MQKSRRGASLLSYGLIVGLISVVALAAVTTTGSSVNSLFQETGGTLGDVVDTNAAQSATATPTETPVVTATSCLSIVNSGGSTGDGVYQIDPDGPGGLSPFDVYCDMTKDGGGWTLAMTHDAPSSGNAWSNTTFSYGAPPLDPNSGNATALDPSILNDLGVQDGMMLMITNRIIKLYYTDGTPTLETGYDRLIKRQDAAGASTHMSGDAPHTGLARNSASTGHDDALCTTSDYPDFLAKSDCGLDPNNSHPSWNNRPGHGTTAGSTQNCWFYGGTSTNSLPNIQSCPSGSQAPFATYTTTVNFNGATYQLWVR